MSIKLHPKKGLAPHLTFCPRCHKEGQEIVLMGAKNFVSICPSCQGRHFGGSQGKCHFCGDSMYGAQRRELDDFERIPGELCLSCQQEEKKHREIVEAGGIYWKCKCGAFGVMTKEYPLAAKVREAANVSAPNPIGLEVENCPSCEKKA